MSGPILIASNTFPEMAKIETSTTEAGRHEPIAGAPWYRGVTSYQWLILGIASAGWVFDVYEGQIFVITRSQLLQDILHVAANDPSIKDWGEKLNSMFLLGGTLGGLLFGSLADRFGRRPMMAVTILVYSLFAGLTFFAQTLWQVAALRFLVALGVGGEWAVAAALVAEVFPSRARAHASGIFHATSVLGTWLAAFAGLWVASNWRHAFLIGVAPALLVAWVMASVREPDNWRAAKAAPTGNRLGSFRDLLFNRKWARRAILGMLLATVGLGTFWGVTVAGKELAEEQFIRSGLLKKDATELAKTAYGIIQTAGGGLGLLAFGPLCVRLGRRRAFTLIQLGALAIVPLMCYGPRTDLQMLCLLPVFGFFTLGMHAGFAIYFPELFPTHLRGTGSAFCFNGGRLLSALVLWLSGELKRVLDLRLAVCLLSLLFIAGLLIIHFLPETKDQPLPD
jgi:MFS family permease